MIFRSIRPIPSNEGSNGAWPFIRWNEFPIMSAFLRKNQKEIESLFKELLINVTRFFRDPEAFEALEKKVSSGLLETN